MLLEDLTWPQIRNWVANDPVLVVPVGSIEQHGEHLPVKVDALTATEVSRRAASRVPAGRVLVAPTVAFGVAAHHMDFAGTISLRSRVFIDLIHDVCLSLLHHGFRRLLLLNGHGGNVPALKVAVQEVYNQRPALIAMASYWDLSKPRIEELRDQVAEGMGHACELETSLVLFLAPELVHTDKVKASNMPFWNSRFITTHLLGGGPVTLGHAVLALNNPSGVHGDPTVATAERGRAFMEAILTDVAALITEMGSWDLGSLVTWR